jgi:hypothetical protein
MRSRPIGTSSLTPTADRNQSRARVGSAPVSGPADIFPVDVRYSGGSRRGDLWRWSRLIITDDALYVARSNDRGKDITSVTKYPLPTGDRVQTGAKRGSWGQFSWSGCGCANSWGRHTKDALIAIGDGTTAQA